MDEPSITALREPPAPRRPGERSWVARVGADLGHGLLGLLWPTCCVACGAPDRDCCAECRELLRGIEGEAQRVLTRAGAAAYVASPYTGPPRALLLALKHGGQTAFAKQLGALLQAPLRAACMNARGPAPPLLVTAPSRASGVRRRGYRHVDLIVRAALRADRTGPRPLLVPRALRARRGRRSQLGLGAPDRLRNAELVAVRAAARGILRGREVVLVDDVVTTGATITAAGRALARAGACVVGVAAICAVDRADRRADPSVDRRADRRAPDGRSPRARSADSTGIRTEPP
ncbi:MAG: ComF family protein [Leucobacter sp.]|nr:ComF family protein [Leucobacter sp.]